MGLRSLLRLNLAVLRARTLPRFVFAAAMAAAVLGVLSSPSSSGQGFEVLAGAADLVLITVASLAAVLGAVSIAGDASLGVLRGVLIRPVSRSAVVLSEALILVFVTVLLYLAGILIAVALTAYTHGFEAIKLGDFVITESSVIRGHAFRLLLLPLPALCCFPLIALLVSILAGDVAAAVVVSLVLVEGPVLVGKLITDLPGWMFSERAFHPMGVLKALATGDNTRETIVMESAYLWQSILVPLGWASAVIVLGLILFNAREVRE